MKVSDYVIKYIADLGVKDVFFVSGGGAMHLNDSLGRNKKIDAVCMLHEQSCAIAAEAYARISGNYGACLVTSGPGGTNTITGLAGAYLDSTPVIFISGQVKRADLAGNQGIRQFGIQEIDIVSIVQSITKYAVVIQDAADIRFELEKATFLAKNGRPGPVWIDIPLDIQAEQIEEESLRGYDKSELPVFLCQDEKITQTIELFNQAKRPLLIIGNGVRLAGAVEIIREFYEYLQIPVMTSWNGVDLIEDDHPLFFGRPGAIGHRSANFIQQNADFVLTIGTRLNLLSTGYNYASFLEKAKHVMVDIDENELHKKNVSPQLGIACDAKEFIEKLMQRKLELNSIRRDDWMVYCNKLKEKYPRLIPEQEPREGYVSAYHLLDEITKQMNGNDIYQFTSSGTSADVAMQIFAVKRGQRAFLTKGLASMGFDLPASIGSCIASGGKRTVCVTGDGSFMMNIQELEILKRLQLPVKLFIVDNKGYSMIWGSQHGNFEGRLTGCTEESGLTLPNIKLIAESFGINAMEIDTEDGMDEKIDYALTCKGPIVCIVKTDIMQKVIPKQANYMQANGQMASRPLDDMMPLLERKEIEGNRI